MKGRKPDANAVRRGARDGFQPSPSTPRAGVSMPDDVAADPTLCRLWQQVAPPVNPFIPSDTLLLRVLVEWLAIAEAAQEQLKGDGIDGSICILIDDGKRARKHPALSVLKEASAEIRALSDTLGLSPLARSRIGLAQAATVKTAAETAAMFQSIADAYSELDGGGIE